MAYAHQLLRWRGRIAMYDPTFNPQDTGHWIAISFRDNKINPDGLTHMIVDPSHCRHGVSDQDADRFWREYNGQTKTMWQKLRELIQPNAS